MDDFHSGLDELKDELEALKEKLRKRKKEEKPEPLHV